MIKVVLVNVLLILAIVTGFHFYSKYFENAVVDSPKSVSEGRQKLTLNPIDSVEGPVLGLPRNSPLLNPKNPDGSQKVYKDNVLIHFIKDHSIFAYGALPNTVGHVKTTYGQDTVYDVHYHYDQHGRRITPVTEDFSDVGLKFAIFFGGSYVHGDGVLANQTLPWHFGDQTSGYVPYNYGFSGYGPQHMYLNLAEMKIDEAIPQKKGIGIYLYFEHHRGRAIGSMNVLSWTEGRYPYVDFNNRGELEHFGQFKEVRPNYTWLMRQLSKLSFLKNRVQDIPSGYTVDASKLFCALITESRNKFHQLFPESPFVVVISPSVREEDPIIRACLAPNGIEYIDRSGQWGEGKGSSKYTILPGIDFHYNSDGYKKLAKEIVRDLKKQNLL